MSRSTTQSSGRPRQLRSDAARNRQLVVEAAARAFAQRGLEVGYDEIARLAGVGVGTVYRRFPERADLVAALFDSQVQEVLDFAAEATQMRDASMGLCWFIEQVVRVSAADQGLQQVLAGTYDRHDRFLQLQTRLVPAVQVLLDRAQQQGTTRADITVADIRVLIKLISSVSTTSHPRLWRRYLLLILDGLTTKRTQPTPLAVPTANDDDLEQLHEHLQ